MSSVKNLQTPKIPISQSFKNETKGLNNASFSGIKHKPFNICQQPGRIGSRAWMQNISTDHPNYRRSHPTWYSRSFHHKTSNSAYPTRALSDFNHFHRHHDQPQFPREHIYGRSQFMSYRGNSNFLLNHYTAPPSKRRYSETYPSTVYDMGPQRQRLSLIHI